MQWSPDRNGGFSRCDPARLYAPMIMDPVYGYESVNVEAQSRSLSSLLNWTKRLIAVRKSSPAFGRGSITFVRPANRAILAYVRQYGDEIILCVANLSRAAQATELDLSSWKDRIPLELLGRTSFPQIGELPYMITLAPYGFYWFKLTEKVSATPAPVIVPEFETLVIPLGAVWESLTRTRRVFERDVLPQHLALARWFPEHSQFAISATFQAAVPCNNEEGISRPWFAFFEATSRNQTNRYLMPLRINWSRFDRTRYNPKALAAVRQGAREGTLVDVASDKDFISLLLQNVHNNFSIEEQGIRVEFRGTKKFCSLSELPIDSVHAVQTEQSNSTALVDHHYVVKIYRKLENGINPEIEMGHFLTEIAGFANTPSLLGHVEAIEKNRRCAIAVVHQLVENQGDAWTFTGNYLDRYIEDQKLFSLQESTEPHDDIGQYQLCMEQTGKRVAEMQTALASRHDIPDFRPEPITDEDIELWRDDMIARADSALSELKRRRDKARTADQDLIDRLLNQADALPERLQNLLSTENGLQGTLNIRHHGDFHLGQMLIVKDDIYIIDFEGEPRRSLAERRRKAPAARDVAGLIRSIDYAATAAVERALKVGHFDASVLTAALEQWRDKSVATFLASYRANLKNERLWPADPAAQERLLNFFLLEKAFYEIEYELSYRPDWLRVPLLGTLRVLSHPVEATL